MERILHLPLKKKWYEMIESGYKTEEYREVKPYWIKRLLKGAEISFCAIDSISDDTANFYSTHPHKINEGLALGGLARSFDKVKFSFGYTKRTIMFKVRYFGVLKGKKQWGAPSEDVFVIGLGQRIE